MVDMDAIVDEDAGRMIRLLIANTTLVLQIDKHTDKHWNTPR